MKLIWLLLKLKFVKLKPMACSGAPQNWWPLDMAVLEAEVRKIETDGLLWGAAKLVAIGYGIKKLQICCVVEDDKVGTDFLEEEICALEDYVQSVDVAAFNKI